ncbi:MAG: lipid biosynthesis acyltransferase, partial [Pedosphaera sp.]|nr:lipid biosynthesis acyltransferase [Pedosphaera sp.]
MDLLLYYAALGLIKFLQALPLLWVARLGRAAGALAYHLDARHRRVVNQNLTKCLGQEKTPDEIRALARENFRRIGENFACAVKTASMSLEELKGHMEVVGMKKLQPKDAAGASTSRVFAIGHFGNFEIFAHAIQLMPQYQGATTYRALHSPRLNRLLLSLREKNGCLFFERRQDGAALRAAIQKKYLLLGLLSDQHSGAHGVRLPFFGQECSTS